MPARSPASLPGRSIDPEYYQGVPRQVTAMAKEFPPDERTPFHHHARSQLIYAVRGVMRVSTAQGVWALPPLRALWMPAGVEHQVEMIGAVSMRTLFVAPDAAQGLWRDCRVIEVSPLLRELILSLVMLPVEYPTDGRAGHIAALTLAELAEAKVLPIHIPWPADRRLQAVCRAILARPGLERTIDEWGEEVGASGRTLIRLFQAELGLNYRQWLQQVRLADALGRLSLGQPVARIAADLGYRSPSAFAAMFRRAMGAPPNAYLNQAASD
ncbi:AraC family transcriptional regulator [Bordetella genomosp. 9]|uniref:AraC family transcriptional regulator n=1 Tax=Bordetella genomosp. 9 TaxID=1416803 RepID=A0A1W6Z179_9BORD|nr:helix-turn-helix transcriptional regulator [Bordetella genomosp. 9]ARP87076.1 AraC family transcriptional regulator [Bordetella genomosp. 9]